VQESGGHVAGGGVSVYYSHMLQLLFFSYTQGKTFAALLPLLFFSYTQGKTFAALLPKAMDELSTVFPINFKR